MITTFGFKPGDKINNRYTVIQKIGKGTEGEVYLLAEKGTGITRAAKCFYPGKQSKRLATKYAKRLHTLRGCSGVIQYHAKEEITHQKFDTFTLVLSEYVEGKLLSKFIAELPGKRMHYFLALHLLHSLSEILESIHHKRTYHGDLHLKNIMVVNHGFTFSLKLMDLYHNPKFSLKENQRADVIDIVSLFYDVLGGAGHYASLPEEIKYICSGKQAPRIAKRFPTAQKLKHHLENIAITECN